LTESRTRPFDNACLAHPIDSTYILERSLSKGRLGHGTCVFPGRDPVLGGGGRGGGEGGRSERESDRRVLKVPTSTFPCH